MQAHASTQNVSTRARAHTLTAISIIKHINLTAGSCVCARSKACCASCPSSWGPCIQGQETGCPYDLLLSSVNARPRILMNMIKTYGNWAGLQLWDAKSWRTHTHTHALLLAKANISAYATVITTCMCSNSSAAGTQMHKQHLHSQGGGRGPMHLCFSVLQGAHRPCSSCLIAKLPKMEMQQRAGARDS